MRDRKISYRPDIDGLRAIAVLLVVLFHININLIPGGYIGVDIFFVISGFLITKIIHNEISSGKFSITNFYVRRARRIIPALTSTIIVTSIFATVMLYPSELVDYAKSAIASALFSANIYFFSSLNYFSPSADEIPLLHLWSLGVEEQFYILFPIFLIAVAKVRMSAVATTCALLVASVTASAYMLESTPSAAFYLLPFRAFEILIGSVIALALMRYTPSRKSSFILCLTGLLGIAFASAMYTHATKFPGLAALLPCVAAALIIVAGKNSDTTLSRVLGNRVLVFVGKISFSLYLVHWPIIVFLKRYNPDITNLQFTVIAFSLSMLLAALNFQIIEKPFRHHRGKEGNSSVLLSASAALLLMVSAGIIVVSNNGFEDNSNTQINKTLSYLKYDWSEDYHSGTCFLNPEQVPSSVDISSCLPSLTGKKVMIWGDSHAIQFYPGMKNALQIKGYSVGALTASACPPILGLNVTQRPNCLAFNNMAFTEILKIHPDVLILSAEWNFAYEGYIEMLDETIKKFSGTGIKIYILGSSPAYKRAVPTIIADLIKSGATEFTSPADLDKELLDYNEKLMRQRFANRADVTYISVIRAACPGGDCPLVDAGGVPVHFDVAHLTAEGSRLMSKNIINEIFN
jgi:peptidoglycan/LPS O-acetylase OafA/YrhL